MSDESRDYRLGQLCEALRVLPLDLAVLLGLYRLHIVTEAEKRVLDAMADVEDIEIDMTLDLRDDLSVRETRVWEAEQARRRTP